VRFILTLYIVNLFLFLVDVKFLTHTFHIKTYTY